MFNPPQADKYPILNVQSPMSNLPSLKLLPKGTPDGGRVDIYIAVAAGAVPFINHGLAFAQVDINAFSLYGLARVLDYEVGGGEACGGG